MGRKSKLKQSRKAHQNEDQSRPQPQFDSTQFVQQLEKLGYQKSQIQQAPTIPGENQPNPTL